MEKMLPLVSEIKQALEPVMRKYAIRRASLFGSFADGTATEDSEIDLLVKLTKPIGLLEFIHIKHELEQNLHIRAGLG